MQNNRAVITDSHTLFEGAPCGLIVTRENGAILRANATFSQWTGFSESELQARRFQDLLTMGGRIFHQTHWAPLMKMQGSVAEVKLDLVHRDGHTVTMLLNAIRREGHMVPSMSLRHSPSSIAIPMSVSCSMRASWPKACCARRRRPKPR